MTNLLIRLFIKNRENHQDAQVRKSYGMLSGIVGIVINILLSASKITVGILSGSIAVLADGLNNLSDTGSSFISLFGFKLAGAPADGKHPFGHARYEYIAGLLIACLILFVGFELVISSIEKIVEKTGVDTSILMMVVLGASILAKLWLFFFYRKLAKTIGSSTIKASAQDSLNDVILTSVILAAALTMMFTDVNLDGYAGLGVAGFVLWSGVKLIRETLSPLLGERPPQDFIARIYQKIRAYDGVVGIHDLVVHNYGPNRNYVSVHVEVDYNVDILVSHELIDKIEREIAEEENIHIVIHMDPIVTDDPELNAIKEIVFSALAEIDPSLTLHDFRVIPGPSRKNLIFDVVIPEGCTLSEQEIKRQIDLRLKEHDASCCAVIAFDRNYI